MLDDIELWSVRQLGFRLYSRDRLDDAAAVFGGLVALQPADAYAWYALALVRRQQQRVGEAVESFQAAIERAPRLWRARVSLAELLYSQGYEDDAVAMLEPVVDAHPSAPAETAALRRGRILMRCWRAGGTADVVSTDEFSRA